MTTNAGAAKIDGNTLFPIFSTEKPLLATAMHRSVERGKLEYDKPVCKYWPEFKGGGKHREWGSSPFYSMIVFGLSSTS